MSTFSLLYNALQTGFKKALHLVFAALIRSPGDALALQVCYVSKTSFRCVDGLQYPALFSTELCSIAVFASLRHPSQEPFFPSVFDLAAIFASSSWMRCNVRSRLNSMTLFSLKYFIQLRAQSLS